MYICICVYVCVCIPIYICMAAFSCSPPTTWIKRTCPPIVLP